jgi:hypothetical protein
MTEIAGALFGLIGVWIGLILCAPFQASIDAQNERNWQEMQRILKDVETDPSSNE